MTELTETWICPPLDGPATGGTLYNAGLLGALAARGVRVAALGLDAGRRALRDDVARRYWVDSLHLGDFADLRRESVTGAPLGLVMHYLPSLVALGRPPERAELSPSEHAALEAAECFLATSTFMRDVLVGLGCPSAHIVTVEPGVDLGGEPSASPSVADTTGSLSALMVANLLPGKGVAAFSRALEPLLDGSTSLELCVVGSPALDDVYARECHALVRASPRLSAAVRFTGALPHHEVVRHMRASHVLVAASRMESFGMALAEARALGLPILARRGGNAAALVLPRAGGQLTDDDAGLASALIELARDPALRRRRATLAVAARATRTWEAAASAFVAATRQ